MAVINQSILNSKAKEHVEWAVAWLENNNIPASIEFRGKHPSFVLERFGNRRRVVFAGTPSSITPNAVFRDVRAAALELGYPEIVDREGRPVTAIASMLAPKPKADDTRHFRGIVVPDYPKEFVGKDGRGMSRNQNYKDYIKQRRAFVVEAHTKGASNVEIHKVLHDAGHPITSGVITQDLQHHETGMSSFERKKLRESTGGVVTRTRSGEVKIPTNPIKKIPLTTLNGIALLIEEAARSRLVDLITVRDNLKKDADAFDEARALMKRDASQIESLLNALTE